MSGIDRKRGYEDESPSTSRKALKSSQNRLDQEIIYRVLIPTKKAGMIIGKAASILKELKSKTGAWIKVLEAVPGCDERVVLISCKAYNGDDASPAEKAAIEVQSRMFSSEEASASNLSPVNAIRLLICNSQAGPVIGKKGENLHSMSTESGGAHVKVLSKEELPDCALSNDRVLLITGTQEQMLKGLEAACKLIRAHPATEPPGGPPKIVQEFLLRTQANRS